MTKIRWTTKYGQLCKKSFFKAEFKTLSASKQREKNWTSTLLILQSGSGALASGAPARGGQGEQAPTLEKIKVGMAHP